MGVLDWKRYLLTKGLYDGDVNSEAVDMQLRRGVQYLEDRIAEKVPSVAGMIWLNGKINPNVSIADVEEALQLLNKFGVANFDALGPPDAPDFIGTPFKQMFISQEDSKLDEYTPEGNQNQGKWQNPAPGKDNKDNQDNEDVLPDVPPQVLRAILKQKSKKDISDIEGIIEEIIKNMR